MTMPPCLTLTTDFGTQEGYVGAMKGAISAIAPAATIVDITHALPPQALLPAAYCLKRSVPHFPQGTIHVAVIDPGVGSNRSALAIATESFWLVGPDNGIFSLVLEAHPPLEIIQIFPQSAHWKAHTSFDGLALFSPVAAHLANGMAVHQIGQAVEDYQKIFVPHPTLTAEGICGEILFFDRFGNAITNISAELLKKIHPARVWVEGRLATALPLKTHYQAGAEEKDLALINSDHLLELSRFCGNLQKEYGLAVGDKVWVCEEGI